MSELTVREITQMQPTGVNSRAWLRIAREDEDDIRTATCSFLDTIASATGRASHYRTKDEQEEAERQVHNRLYNLDRGLYAALLMYPGVLDRARMMGFENLLARAGDDRWDSLLTPEEEGQAISYLASSIPPHRMIKLFVALRAKRVNNARARKIVLHSLLGSRKLDWWSVNYRVKTQQALEHVWGKRRTGIIKSILAKGSDAALTDLEREILHDHVDRYNGGGSAPKRRATVRECVSFILGNESVGALTPDLIRRYVEGKGDFSKLSKLPADTQEGLRSTYHKERTHAEVLKAADKSKSLTSGQRMRVQSSAEAKGVEIKFDAGRQEAVALYVYAYERGMTDEIEAALAAKAKKAAESLPGRFRRVGILVDCSLSMFGHETQKLRPMAVALATRDMLAAASDDNVIRYVGGERDGKLLRRPKGDTSMAEGLIELLEEENLDGIFVLTDGYENAPAGRVAEVIGAARQIGISTPITQLSPVFAGETEGLRFLAGDKLPAYPVQRPEALGVTLVRDLLTQNPVLGLSNVVSLSLQQLREPKKSERKEVAA